jgi:hypothetical protein
MFRTDVCQRFLTALATPPGPSVNSAAAIREQPAGSTDQRPCLRRWGQGRVVAGEADLCQVERHHFASARISEAVD